MICRSPWKALLRRLRLAARSGDGFTLVEMMIALAVMALMFAGTALVLGSTLTGAAETRLKQHAVEAATEILEGTRAMDYASVATQNTADLAALNATGVAYIAGSPGAYTFDPDGSTGPLLVEPLVISNSASIDPVQQLQRNGATFNVWTVVTDPAGTTRVKRVTTRVSWTQDGQTFSRRISTLVTETRRGLPLPNFAVGTDMTLPPKTTDQELNLPFSITNNGARDNWNIVAKSSPSAAWVDDIVWYRDDDPVDGQKSAGEVVLGDVSGDSVVDTGLLETDDLRKVVGWIDLAQWQIDNPTGSVTAGTYVITVSLGSASQPTTPAKTVELMVTLSAPVASCGCTYHDYWFHNASPPSSADANLVTGDMPATSTSTSLLATLPNYDKNKDSAANSGRTILTGGTDYSENTATKIAKWQYQLPIANTVKVGTVTITVWVAMEDFAAGTAVLNGYAHYSTTGSGTNPIGATGAGTSGPVTIPASTWVPVTITIPVAADISIAASKYLRAYVTNAGSGNVWIAYGTTTHPARINIPLAT